MNDANIAIDGNDPASKRKPLILSARKRLLLHRLLHRDLRRCSTSSLEAFERCGWTRGSCGAHELTEQGRRVAEMSELSPQNRDLQLDLS